MAPEFLREEHKFSAKSDVYSFGITLWEIITERQPYEDLQPIQVSFLVINKGIRPETKGIEVDEKRLIEKCW